MGQAHNQMNRAVTEFGQLGFGVRGIIVTHLTKAEPSARASAGAIRIISKDAVLDLWSRLEKLFRTYAKNWSLDDPASRLPATKAVQAKCPAAGWLFRALDADELFVSSASLLKEWGT